MYKHLTEISSTSVGRHSVSTGSLRRAIQ